ncbi:MAG: hypothetical protein AB7Q42_20170 [Acidimicrobiia bacterium]
MAFLDEDRFSWTMTRIAKGEAAGPDDADVTSTIRLADPPAGWSTAKSPARLWSGAHAPWRQVAERKRLQLEGDIDRVRPGASSADMTEIKRLVALLERARALIIDGRTGFTRWWTGSSIEHTWALLREVEEGLMLLTSTDAKSVADDAWVHASYYLAPKDSALVAFNKLREGGHVPPKDRSLALLRNSHSASDGMHQQARSLRNTLFTVSALISLAMVTLCVIQWRARSFSFIDVPSPATGPVNYANAQPWVLLSMVMLFGCLGALLTVIGTLSKAPSAQSPFNLPRQQALLKVAAGSLTSTLGIMLVASDQVTGGFASLQALLAAALALGASQQAVTRFADKRAKDLLSPASASSNPTT